MGAVVRAAVAALLLAQGAQAFEPELQAVTDQLVGRLNQDESTKTVAVVEFRNLDGDLTGLGRFLSQQFAVHLLNSAGFELFNRSKLARLIDEIRLSEEGLVSPESAKRLELEGVEVLITGTVTELGETAQLSIEALRTSSARIVAAATGKLPLTGDLRELAGRRLLESGGSSSTGGRTTSSQLILPGAKEIGPFEIALADLKLVAARARRGADSASGLAATFEIINKSQRNIMVAVSDAKDGTTATDNLAHLFEYSGGLKVLRSWYYKEDALALAPGGKNEVTILFTCQGVAPNEVGDRFTVTWLINALDADSEQATHFAVSFRDIVLRH